MNTNKTSRFADETHVAAPLGKQTVRGVIVSTKTKETDYGPSYKMTVKVQTPAGSWLCWGTIPMGLFDEADKKLENVEGWIVALRGCEVQFTATLEAGSDAHFVFVKRPTKATILTIPEGKARQPKPWDEGYVEPAEDPFAQFDTVAA